MVSDKDIIKEVKKFFSTDAQRDAMLIHSATSISSPQFDSMTKASANDNGSITYHAAKRRQTLIKAALDSMDQDEASVLNMLYLQNDSITKVSMTLCMSRRSIFRLRNHALIDFAYCYNFGELLDRIHDEETATT
ncbi:ArpU family phage packaging/lysis transcriptional regulator [Limosilactobacillus reuteri]|uniref:hypothetical protein n=1 Tax=Limosilactobacillus reuteri TaxID=1598 RepID=UPI001E3AA412|nr:hypothetical protein [Limosilactobacillus reuteri]MCC4482469.1 hypothetical protein [Limosilactobacillus reuteri]